MFSLGEMVRKSQPDVFWCMRSLPKPKREAMYTLFAFARHIDDLWRSTIAESEKEELLKAWRVELDNIYDKQVPTTNIGRKIYKNCLRFNLPKDLWIKILDSAEMQVPTHLSAPSQEKLESYLLGAAVVPLQLALLIVEPKHPKADAELAKNLGVAIALTFILRDIKDDAQDDLVYFPLELLQKVGVEIAEPQHMVEDKHITDARQELALLVKPAFSKSERLLAKMNKKDTITLRYLKNLSESLYAAMEKRGWEIMAPKLQISRFKRLGIAAKTIWE